MSLLKKIILFLFITSATSALAQETATIYGIITDDNKKPLDLVNVSIAGLPGGTMTNKIGYYELQVPANHEITVLISFVGYTTESFKIKLSANERRGVNKTIKTSSIKLPDLIVKDNAISRTTNLIRIDPKTAAVMPSFSGGIESLIKTMPGVSSNNELSSQYSVRGGNYDENLVYVNDIEIYKPFLIRSGQQEGLSFLNPDMVSSILFSAGGFEAKYGDKMSSVLDIQYKKPQKFKGSASGSLLGGSVHLEGVSKNKRFTYLLGIRQKSNSYLLKNMQTKGDYQTSFTDVQTLLTYDITSKLEVSVLGNYARNYYKVVPHDRETNFGTLNEALRLKIYFEGQEVDRFVNYLGALSFNYHPSNNLKIKFITSAFCSDESETYDILGQYWIGKLETDDSQNQSKEVVEASGVGTFLNHARNYLDATVYNFEQRGSFTLPNNTLLWGIKYQHETINDKMREWSLIDSAGYALPYVPDSIGAIFPNNNNLYLKDVISSDNNLSSNRYTGFVENVRSLDGERNRFILTLGIRGNYWDLNHEFLLSPRVGLSFKPSWENDILFRLSSGYYYQPPFYRELRDFQGNINTNLKAQSSIHFVAGSDWNFMAWSRPFKFVSEIYYKYLDNLIPYEVDNVRIRYFTNQIAKGYATGIDMKVNGEFVNGIESWASLSVMKTEEDIKGDLYYDYYNREGDKIIAGFTTDNIAVDSTIHHPGYIPRPTDQRINFGLFFQDYLPKNPSYKMHINLLFGSSLPFGPPNSPKYKHTMRIPPYRRVDIGFSKLIKGENSKLPHSSLLNYFKTIWLTAEVFNLLQVNNTVSYLWVTDVNNRQYAVPNYLTSRQLNIKLVIEF